MQKQKFGKQLTSVQWIPCKKSHLLHKVSKYQNNFHMHAIIVDHRAHLRIRKLDQVEQLPFSEVAWATPPSPLNTPRNDTHNSTVWIDWVVALHCWIPWTVFNALTSGLPMQNVENISRHGLFYLGIIWPQLWKLSTKIILESIDELWVWFRRLEVPLRDLALVAAIPHSDYKSPSNPDYYTRSICFL